MPTRHLKVLIHVQHLLGTGHLQRSAIIARALVKSGIDVHLISGGRPVETIDTTGVTLVQMPPIHAHLGDFATLVDANNQAVSDATWQSRRQLLLERFNHFSPHVVITETFPFGRRGLRHELLPFIREAKSAKCKIVCSVRDILQTGRKLKRLREACTWVNDHFDLVLVHGDPNFCTFETTFPLFGQLTVPVQYTGFVTPARSTDEDEEGQKLAPLEKIDVLVSAGGGAVGHQIYEAALGAAKSPALSALHFVLLIGRNLGTDAMDALRARRSANVSIHWARPDFPSLLRKARVSVSQAGYNTVLDLIDAGVASVLVPYEGAGETEQRLRAESLVKSQPVRVLTEPTLTSDTLAAALTGLLQQEGSLLPDNKNDHSLFFDMNGARNSANAIRELMQVNDPPAN